jgi:pyridoxal/pyridoxine/pyridoxamine kinase
MVRSFGTASATRALLQGFLSTFHQIGRYSRLQQTLPLLNILCDPVINDTKDFLTAARVMLDTI